ncbi:hypothetical protein [Soonwooa sp.]|uniref:hypothetical protein n=1 Tax=Soonwooa sp. TaxID=1938592 RepID=UPI00262E07EE|nr:hypothetical protein [Soonwooa sp.]
MIRKVKYQDIDFIKYEKCLDNAVQNSDYARKEFLDVVTDQHWELLVFEDYEAVMPISYVMKLGFKIVLMPKLCQQLGIFSTENSTELNDSFLKYFQKNYKIIFYAFNKNNQFSEQLPQKTSFELSKNDYDTVKKNYSVHRRRNVRIIGDLVGTLDFDSSFKGDERAFFCANAKGTMKDDDLDCFFDLMENLAKKNLGQKLVMRWKNEIQSLVFLYQTKENSYLSLFVNDSNLSNKNLPSIMIDHCLQEYIADRNFDFMGSEVKNVADFNARFGADSYKYSIILQSKLSLLKNLLKTSF